MPSSYNIPLDSPLAHKLESIGGPEPLLNGLSIAVYVNLAALTLLFWDHIITFDKEVERIWTLPWRLPKYLFLMNRYLLSFTFIFGWAVFTEYDNSVPFCNFVWRWKMWPSRVTIVSVQMIIILRVLALYSGSNKLVSVFVITAYIWEVGGIIALNIINILRTHAIETFGVSPGCIFKLVPESLSNNWIPPIIFEGIIIVLTMYKLYPYNQDRMSLTTRLLARDSIIYFLFMMSIHIINFVIWRTDAFIFGDAYATPSSVLACIVVSRMMMNMRALSSNLQLQLSTNLTNNGLRSITSQRPHFAKNPFFTGSESSGTARFTAASSQVDHIIMTYDDEGNKTVEVV